MNVRPRRETAGVLALTVLIVLGVGLYLGLRSVDSDSASLMPYQMLVKDLVSSDQQMFATIQGAAKEAEAQRAATGKWPDASDVSRLHGTSYAWTFTQKGFFVNYLGLPQDDASVTAWLLMVQEPDPAALTDPAPEDEVHHKLPDGTMLHVTIWTHRFGRQVTETFLNQPESTGWVQVLIAPVVPVVAKPKT